MEKITIMGAGNVAAHAAVSAATLELGNVVLLDKNGDLAKGKERVIDMAGILDGGRFIYFIAQELNIRSSEVVTMVLGDLKSIVR